MAGGTTSLAAVIAAVLTAQPVTGPPAGTAFAPASTEPCVIVLPVDPLQSARLPELIQQLIDALVALVPGGAVAGGAAPDGYGSPRGTPEGCGSHKPETTDPDPDEEGADEDGASRPEAGTGRNLRVPGDLLNLQHWFLTLPVGQPGDPDSIDQPELLTYSSEHFELTPDGDAVVFRAPAGGVTTENSTYPRSELREVVGGEKAAWSNTSGTHVLETTQAITDVPPAKPEVVAAQIHDGADDVLQIRLEGKRLTVQYADGAEEIVIDPAYRLGTPYDLRIVAANGGIEVFYNGEQAAEIARSGSGWYWKVGAYPQSNPERGDSPDALGEVLVYSLSVQHTGA